MQQMQMRNGSATAGAEQNLEAEVTKTKFKSRENRVSRRWTAAENVSQYTE
jgi:hypothetical protein